MTRPEAKNLRRPEQIRRFPNGRIDVVSHHETTVGRFSLEPGRRWSRDVGPIAQTRSCQIHHLGVVLKGRLRVEPEAGEVCEFEVDDVYDIPPGHNATVVSDETFWAIEFASARIFAMPTDGDRVLAAVLCRYSRFNLLSPPARRLGLARLARRTTSGRVKSSTGFEGERSGVPAMAFLPYSTDPLGQFDAQRQSVRR
jgi:hypothetical protein